MSLKRSLSLAILLLTVLVATSRPSRAQPQSTMSGVVLIDSILTPITEARVSLLTEAAVPTGIETRSDSVGGFTLRLPGAGKYRLMVSRIGYEMLVSPPVDASPGKTLKLEVFLMPVYQPLNMIRTEVRTPPLHPRLAEFDWRRSRLAGRFITAEQIEQRNAIKLSDLVSELAGVRIREQPETHTSDGERVDTLPAGVYSIRRMVNPCPMRIFVDGIPLAMTYGPGSTSMNTLAFEQFNTYLPGELYGIEVYLGPTQVPGEFTGFGGEWCGIIAIWRRR